MALQLGDEAPNFKVCFRTSFLLGIPRTTPPISIKDFVAISMVEKNCFICSDAV